MRNMRQKIEHFALDSLAGGFRMLVGATALTAMVSAESRADTSSTSVDAYVGLSEAYSVECIEDVHFGVYRVETDDRGGSTKITLSGDAQKWDDPDIGLAGPGATGVALSTAAAHDPPQLAVCEVRGAPGLNETGSVSFANDGQLGESPIAFQGVEDSADYAFGDIGDPGSAAGLTGKLALRSETVTVDERREATLENGFAITIGGEVDLPNQLVSDNLGGYKAIGQVEVYVTFTSE